MTPYGSSLKETHTHNIHTLYSVNHVISFPFLRHVAVMEIACYSLKNSLQKENYDFLHFLAAL